MKKIICAHILGFLLLPLITHAAEKPLNFINIVVDDMGYSDIGCMGGPVETPNLDKLAGGGILFTDYRTYPKCAPTRDAIMTGMDAPPVRTEKDGVTLAEALQPAGYGTYFVGKAHGSVIGSLQAALKRGFDRSFGNSAGGNFWDPATRQTYLDGKSWSTDKPFYKTDMHTDFAINFLEENGTEKPFFLHLAYHAPHFPIHAKQADINKYAGKFMDGPSALRRKRFARMKALGVLPEGTALAPDFTEMENAWAQLPVEKKEFYDRVMAGYCAMIDCVDQNIGRLLAQLDKMGARENTVIFFSSDNGGCAEGGEGIWPGHWDSRFGRTYDRNAEFGGENSHWQVGEAWAHLSNTPLREWKSISHEGGLSVPFIVNAPAIIQSTGQISRKPVMVMDIMPTILDLAHVTYPEVYHGRTVKPMRGVSLKPLFEGKETDLSRPMHFFFKETAAYIEYPWKIVTKDTENFELYHLEKDRTELNNLATQMPEKLSSLKAAMQDYRRMPLKNKKGKKTAASPNVLLIAIDDLNDWIGCMGGHPQAKTPNMDRLAARGVLFNNAHCQSPVCNPSRASMMTSLYPSTSGVYFLTPDLSRSPVAKKNTLLPKRFQDEGYYVTGAGKLFHGNQNKNHMPNYAGSFGGFGPLPENKISPFPEMRIWDWGVFPEKDELMTDHKIAEWGVQQLSRQHDKPLFLATGFYTPHVPQYAPQKWFDMYPMETLQLPKVVANDLKDISEYGINLTRLKHVAPTMEWVEENDQWKPLVQSYLACISFTDHQVGKLLDALDNSAYRDNTYIVLYTDHGFHQGEKERFAKRSLWEDGTRTPMIIAGPGIVKGGVCSKPAQLLDIYPTLLELTGLKADPKLEGDSLVPLLKNPQADWPHMARSSFGPGNYAIVSEHYRYIHYNDGTEEFYDRAKDPHEWNNVITNPEYAAMIKKHRAQIPQQRHEILGQNSTGHRSFEASEAVSRGEPVPADNKGEKKKRKK